MDIIVVMESKAELNWAGNYQYSVAAIDAPPTMTDLQETVARSHSLRVLGTRHSFNGIADSNEKIISLMHWDKVVGLDTISQTVTVEAGVRYGELGSYLYSQGFALHNMASLPHISVAGAIATATHGSGDENGNLATAVRGMEMVKATGEIVSLSASECANLTVHLGALGVVTKVTLAIEPSFSMRQDVYENLPCPMLLENFDAITSSGYSVSLFTDWQTGFVNQIWCKRRDAPFTDMSNIPETFFGATIAPQKRHPIASVSPENCTEQGIVGPWHERLPHFRLEFTPSQGDELQSEYFVPREYATRAFQALAQIAPVFTPQLLISEIRTIAADTLWMSPCYQTNCVTFHFTWENNWPEVSKILPEIEKCLAPFYAKPHWGKLFTMQGDKVRSLYPQLIRFEEVCRHYDTTGKFQNAFLRAIIA